MAIPVEFTLAPPAVVGNVAGARVEGWQVGWIGWGDHRHSPAGFGRPSEYIGDGVSALHARVPGHQDRGHPLPPGLHHYRTACDHHYDGARVGIGYNLDQVLVVGVQPQRSAVAAGDYAS